jgi:alpha-beta hydrolase superfamily lysophospholipase
VATAIGRAALSIAVLGGLVALILGSGLPVQNWLLYFPGRAAVSDVTRGGLAAWPSEGDFRGLVAEPVGTPRATAVVFHGNAGHAGHRGFYAEALVPVGVRVILAEYPGYGPRRGKLGEASFLEDARATLRRAHAQHGAPLIVMGESLGASVAAGAAAVDRDKVVGLWLITPWDRLVNVAKHHYPFAPVGLLLRDRYDSVEGLATFDRPVLVDVAEHDEIVPARFGRALYESLKAPKRLRLIRGARHNDWPVNTDDNWWRAALDFLLDGRLTADR